MWKALSAVEPSPILAAALRVSPLIADAIAQPTACTYCVATVGAVSNPDHMNANDGKAGRTRWKGRRPTVRGVAMNPVDHPHGGGEGRTSGGRHPVSPWGKPTKGYKTRKKAKWTNKSIIRRRKKK